MIITKKKLQIMIEEGFDQNTSNTRDILNIALIIFDKIPESQKEFKKIMRLFIYNDMPYRSPEVINSSLMWQKFQSIMHSHITTGDEPWKQECIDIFTGKI
jgi:hypothetical protein